MKTRIIIASLIVIGLIMGGTLMSQEAGAWEYRSFIPYNTNTGGWNTGFHIVGTFSTAEEFMIDLYDTGGLVKTVSLDLADHHGGWTGMLDDLFNLPPYVTASGKEVSALAPEYTPPVRLYIYSTLGRFTVTQFFANSTGGFGFQTFFGWPASWDWPYYTGPVALSQPLAGDPEEWREDEERTNPVD